MVGYISEVVKEGIFCVRDEPSKGGTLKESLSKHKRTAASWAGPARQTVFRNAVNRRLNDKKNRHFEETVRKCRKRGKGPFRRNPVSPEGGKNYRDRIFLIAFDLPSKTSVK